MTIGSWCWLAARFLEILTFTHIDEKLHFVLFVFLGDKEGPKTKFRSHLDYLHVFRKLFLPLELSEIFIIFVLVFRVRDLDHVLVE